MFSVVLASHTLASSCIQQACLVAWAERNVPAGRVQNRRVKGGIHRPKAYCEGLFCRTCDASCPGFPYIMFLGLWPTEKRAHKLYKTGLRSFVNVFLMFNTTVIQDKIISALVQNNGFSRPVPARAQLRGRYKSMAELPVSQLSLVHTRHHPRLRH